MTDSLVNIDGRQLQGDPFRTALAVAAVDLQPRARPEHIGHDLSIDGRPGGDEQPAARSDK